MNYDFPSKRHWRRSLWNCVADRLQVPARDAMVLYLAGEQDQDREVAIQKGFRGRNLIAIESDRGIAKSLRAKGTFTLVGDAMAHVEAWRPDNKIDALILDLCCGMTDKVVEFVVDRLLAHPALQGAVVAINMQRGRDAQGNEFRAYAQEALLRQLNPSWDEAHARSTAVRIGACDLDAYRAQLKKMLGDENTKSRAVQLRMLVLQALLLNVMSAYGMDLDAIARSADGLSAMRRAYASVYAALRDQTLSYRSTKCATFDTLIFVNALHRGVDDFSQIAQQLDDMHKHSPLRRQQAAVMATRTRRIREAA